MSNIGSYNTRPFSEGQKFLVLDPATGTTSLVLGSDLVNYIAPSLNYVFGESTRLAAENADYAIGSLIQTSGATSPGDNFAATYLVVGAGEGDFPMINGNDLLVIRGDELLREQLVQPVATFNNVADMVADLTLPTNRKARTLGYYAPGDGGGNDYEIVASATGTADGGSFIDLDNGLQAKGLFNGGIKLKQFGAVGDYDQSTATGTDDAPFLNKAANYVTKIGGGEIELNGRFLIDTAATLTRGVTLKGSLTALDLISPTSGADYGNLLRESALFINGAISVSVQMASIKNCLVMRKGLKLPFTSASEALTGLSNFSGTAFTGDSYGCTFRDLLILGFDQAIDSFGNGRAIYENVKGDNNSGIRIEQAFGIARINNCHFWPYTTASQSWSNKPVTSTGISFTSPSTIDDSSSSFGDYRAGDVILVTTTSGTNDGVYEVATASASSLTVVETTLTTESAASAGSTDVETRQLLVRTGAAFRTTSVADWAMLTNNFCYGYDRGFVVSSCNSVTLRGCGADNISYEDTGTSPNSIGILVSGTSSNTHITDCRVAAQNQSVVISSTGTAQGTHISSLSEHACRFASVVISQGDVDIVGTNLRNSPTGLYINNPSSKINIIGLTFQSVDKQFFFNTTNNNVIIDGVSFRLLADGADVLYGSGSGSSMIKDITATDPLNLPMRGTVFTVTGTTGFTAIAGLWPGREITLIFNDALTVTDGSFLNLAGNFTTSAGDTLKLVSDGLIWHEISRSVN